MLARPIRYALAALVLGMLLPGASMRAQTPGGLVPRFDRPSTGLLLERQTRSGVFAHVVGRKAALFGYENGAFEAWSYPLKIVHDLELAFSVEDYPVPITGAETMAHIEVRPEATTLTYAHAAFTIRQITFSPPDEAGVIVLLDVDTVRPLTISVAFRPDLSLMWPAGLMTNGVVWEPDAGRYLLVEETRRFAGVIGSPLAEDVSIQPYQEEPKDLPTRFEIRVTPEMAEQGLVPLVIAGSVEGWDAARATHARLLADAAMLYDETVAYYDDLLQRTMHVDTPDERFDQAFAWAKVGIEKGIATNPYLGTGLVAGYRTAGNSERPGFAWFFGRDALWTAFATTAYGDYDVTRAALDFLVQFQRDDGKIPHEISQSASLLNWFDDYVYPWASADATPLFITVHADLWRNTGDAAFLRAHWEALKAAYRFTLGTDTDGNELIENYNPPDGPDFGHGWVEGGELYPGHEEIYMQGLWIAALEDLAELADVMEEPELARTARRRAQAVREAMEAVYWQEDEGYYAFSTRRRDGGIEAWPEITVLQAVPMWWRTVDEARAQRAIDHLGSGAIATDWGARILSQNSDVYDPLSYHNGSVWPLFTGWQSLGAYNYARPHVGFQGLMATALLTYQDALGYVTELLSGDYNTAFGRSSHHQIWSEAMVSTPAIRGLLGIEVTGGAQVLHLAPQLPADWDVVAIERVPIGSRTVDVAMQRGDGGWRFLIEPRPAQERTPITVRLAPWMPGDARVEAALVDGEPVSAAEAPAGDGKRIAVETTVTGRTEVELRVRGGTDVWTTHAIPEPGAVNEGLRILRSSADADGLTVVLEGKPDRAYTLAVRSDRAVTPPAGLAISHREGRDAFVLVSFEGPEDTYIRRTLRFELE